MTNGHVHDTLTESSHRIMRPSFDGGLLISISLVASMNNTPLGVAGASGFAMPAGADMLTTIITWVTMVVSVIRIIRFFVDVVRWLAALRRRLRSGATAVDRKRSQKNVPSQTE